MSLHSVIVAPSRFFSREGNDVPETGAQHPGAEGIVPRIETVNRAAASARN